MLYHFHLDFSDIDRGVYESLDFRVVQHPSETSLYLLSRVLAYALIYQQGLEFSAKGLGDPESPAMMVPAGVMGGIELWVEIGNPSVRKLHKATKAAKRVCVFTYKNSEILIKEILDNAVHRAREIEIYSIQSSFLEELETHLKKNNRWTILMQQGQVNVDINGTVVVTDVLKKPF